jgi:pimeloyl-ACP methyl ester carboxylesterase
MLRSTYVGFFQLPWIPEALLRANNFALLRLGAHAIEPRRHLRRNRARRLPRRLGRAGCAARHARLVPRDAARAAARREDRGAGAHRLGRCRYRTRAGLAQAALRYCRNGHIVRLPRASHWLHHEEPDELNALLVEFLGEGRSAAAATTESRSKNAR